MPRPSPAFRPVGPMRPPYTPAPLSAALVSERSSERCRFLDCCNSGNNKETKRVQNARRTAARPDGRGAPRATSVFCAYAEEPRTSRGSSRAKGKDGKRCRMAYRAVPAIQSAYSTWPSCLSTPRAMVMRCTVGAPSSSHMARQSRYRRSVGPYGESSK